MLLRSKCIIGKVKSVAYREYFSYTMADEEIGERRGTLWI